MPVACETRSYLIPREHIYLCFEHSGRRCGRIARRPTFAVQITCHLLAVTIRFEEEAHGIRLD